MELIKPNLIPEAILRLIDDATLSITMVTPNCKISNWISFAKRLDKAKKKDISVTFFIKHGDYKSRAEVEALNVNPTIIKNLNSIIFMNESYAIISSKSLFYTEDELTLEMAFKTTNEQEYAEVKNFFDRYIKNPSSGNLQPVPILQYMNFQVGQPSKN